MSDILQLHFLDERSTQLSKVWKKNSRLLLSSENLRICRLSSPALLRDSVQPILCLNLVITLVLHVIKRARRYCSHASRHLACAERDQHLHREPGPRRHSRDAVLRAAIHHLGRHKHVDLRLAHVPDCYLHSGI